MAIVSLLRLPTQTEPRERWAFVFEHDQAHRKWTGSVQQANKAFQAYLLDPMRNENWPGSKWHLDHQLAHREISTGPPPVLGQILADSNLNNPKQRAWWEFMNHREHFLNQ